MMHKFQTENGYMLSEAASALQKTIRRGLEEEAMFWAVELETKYHLYLWRRLRIISVEDVGLAEPPAVLYVAEMWRLYADLRKEFEKGRANPSHKMALANAVLALCRAKKSRIGDEFQIVIYGRRTSGWRLEVPDYALDMHTGRGRAMGRGQEHFFDEGAQLENKGRIRNPYSDEAREIRMNPPKDATLPPKDEDPTLF